jgi:rhodanese-related sulfurtransferase
MNTIKTISTHELFEKRSQEINPNVVDVRIPREFCGVHISGAVNVPFDRVADGEIALMAKESTVYVVCQRGVKAREACEMLSSNGVENIVLVEGGMEEWKKSGYEVVLGEGGVSIERQVRIAAGSLVLIGTLLGIFIHVWFLAVPLFVGAGLTFAGITDTCAMGMLMVRMPWNKVADTPNATVSA